MDEQVRPGVWLQRIPGAVPYQPELIGLIEARSHALVGLEDQPRAAVTTLRKTLRFDVSYSGSGTS